MEPIDIIFIKIWKYFINFEKIRSGSRWLKNGKNIEKV